MSDLRQHPRYLLRWSAALVLNDHGRELSFAGRTHDISIGGLSLLTEDHVPALGRGVLVLAPPPIQPGQTPPLITAHVRVVYNVHSGRHLCFRLGLEFVTFDGPGRRQLADRLEHHVPLFEKAG